MAASVKKEVDVESDEDKELKEELKALVEKIEGHDKKLYLSALEMLRYLIRTATTSMTSVPKPLKYLAEYYERIKVCQAKIKDVKTKKLCADIVSVLAMGSTVGKSAQEKLECLNYCLMGSMTDVGDWGHEYIRQLEYEIVEDWTKHPEKCSILFPLVNKIIEFDCKHHAEIQACDLLMEIDQLEILDRYINIDTYQRICLYLSSCSNFVDEMETAKTLEFIVKQYLKFNENIKALLIAMQLRDDALINHIFASCEDKLVMKQMAYIAGRQQICVHFSDHLDDKEELENITCNSDLNHLFHLLARELDIMEPKSPEEIYKTWLEPSHRPSLLTENVDSARQNLASSFVNAFINAGFGRDKLITTDDGSKWIYRNKDHAMISATASLGLIHLWDVDGGLSPIDKYLYTEDSNIKAGALMALGIVNCRVKNECDPALALLSDYIQHKTSSLQVGAIFGLGLAYAGTNRQDVIKLLLPVIQIPKAPFDVIGVVCLSCGLIAVSSCDPEVSSIILEKLIVNKDAQFLTNAYVRFMLLGLALLYLGKRDAIETPTAALEVFSDPFKSLAQTILQMCAYAGTGDVLIIQEFLHTCCEKYETPTKIHFKKTDNAAHTKNKSNQTLNTTNEFNEVQATAGLGVALVSMGDDIGNKMSSRIFGHMAQYGDVYVRRIVPLGMALCSISNPQLSVIDVLNKYSHDSDDQVCCNAIISMGLIGAGTNNARLATMLRQLAAYHSRNQAQLFMVRLAQGLIHLGRGTLTLNPFHTDKQLCCTTALAGLLITIFALADGTNSIFAKAHYLLYSLAAAMQPRWLITLDENMEQVSVPVRVGQAVDIVAKAGTPKTIAGIHTHSTPVLLAVGERAELATEQYEQLTPIMEGVVILRKNDISLEN